MTQSPPPEAGGLFASVKGVAASLVAIVQTRLELLAADVAEERERLTTLLVLVLLALFCFGVGIVLLSLLIVVVLWESNRLLALGALIGLFLLLGGVFAALAVNRLRTSPRMFEASISELQKDREQLEAKP
jgi:uncharacterized membrane protein YqjE